MTAAIYDPLEEYENRLRALHLENTNTFLQQLVEKSGVDIEENRRTVAKYHDFKEQLLKLRRKLGWRRFWRVLMCITLVLIPLVITKITPQIKALRKEIEEGDAKAAELILSDTYDFIAVYNGNYDSQMHKTGPESAEALGELRANAHAFGTLTALIESHWKAHRTLVGFAMDHGCHEIDGGCGSHGLDMEEDLNIVHRYRVYPAVP